MDIDGWVGGWVGLWCEARGGTGQVRGCFPRTITARTWAPTPLRQAPPRPRPPARLLTRPPPPRCRACGAGLRELDLFSPQALQEERKAEDCSPSKLARQVGSEVSAAGRGGSSAGCSGEADTRTSACLKCCWVLTSGGEMDSSEPQTRKTQTREARSRI